MGRELQFQAALGLGPWSDDVAGLRREYSDRGLDEADLAADPMTMFAGWFEEARDAAGLYEPNAMVVATVSADGQPSSRMVLLKGFSETGFVFFTNQASRKGVELAAEPRCALLFPWHPLERQVRVEGTASVLPDADVAAYFASRPRGSRLGAHASHQSRVVASRAELQAAYDEAERDLSRRGPGARGVGRVPGAAGGRGVLAGPAGPDARPAGVPTRRERAGAPSGSLPRVCSMSLLERDAALQGAADYLADAVAGDGRVVFVAGEAGVGKTVFVDAVVERRAPRSRVAQGACDGSATPAPLGPLREMLPDLPAEVWPDGVERHEVFTRLSEALRDPVRPFLLVIEDAHWADDATLDLVRHLARRAHRLRALVLVTYRAEETVGQHPLRVLLGDVASAVGHPPHRPRPAHAGRRTSPGRGGARGRPRCRRAVPRDRGQLLLRHRGARGRRRRRAAQRARRRAVAHRPAVRGGARGARRRRPGGSPRRAVAGGRGLARQRGRPGRGAGRRGAAAPGRRADVPPRAGPAGDRGGGAPVAGDRPAPADPGGARGHAGRGSGADGPPGRGGRARPRTPRGTRSSRASGPPRWARTGRRSSSTSGCCGTRPTRRPPSAPGCWRDWPTSST